MIGLHFSLRPFPGRRAPSASIRGSLAREGTGLVLRYAVCGDLGSVVLPPIAPHPRRRSGLWETTCFELFVAPLDAPHYWEFNLSPSGDWNVYRFTGYREARQEETRIASLPASVEVAPERLGLQVTIDLPRVLCVPPVLEVGASAVIETCDGARSYWALAHPGPEPDFHRREAFLLRLELACHGR